MSDLSVIRRGEAYNYRKFSPKDYASLHAKSVSYILNEIKEKYKEHIFSKDPHNPTFEKISIETSMKGGLHEFGKPMRIYVSINAPQNINSLEMSFQIFSKRDESSVVYNWFSTSNELIAAKGRTGVINIDIDIPNFKLYKGEYYFKFHLSDPRGKIEYEKIHFIAPFEVIMGDIYNEWGFVNDVCRYIENCKIKVSF
jgi:hypothetical protein